MRSSPNHGEGSVLQESVNKYTAKITLGRSPDDKPLIKKFSAKTKKEVERKLRDFKKMQASQAAPSPVHFTVRDYFEYRLKTYPISNQYRKTTLLLSYTGSTPRGSGICSVRSKSEII